VQSSCGQPEQSSTVVQKGFPAQGYQHTADWLQHLLDGKVFYTLLSLLLLLVLC
jgi:hypothetical protein